MTEAAQTEPAPRPAKKPRPLWRRLLDRVLWVVLAGLAYVLIEILVPAWPCPYRHFGWAVERTQDHIRAVQDLAYGYRQARRRYPMSLSGLAESAREVAHPRTFTDGWGRLFIYNVPGWVNTHAFDLYSKGRNGIDDDGGGDDITNWCEPEPLYYGRDHHRGWLNSTAFDVGAAFALGWLVWVLCRWRRLYRPGREGRRPVLRWVTVPRWLGPSLALVAATAAFLHFPGLKAEYYYWRWAYLSSYPTLQSECPYWRWTRLLPRPPEGPHTNLDDAAETLIYMGPSAAPVVAAKLNHPSLAGRRKRPLREQTVRLLGLIGDPSVTPVLSDLLLSQPHEPHYVPRAIVAQALRRLGDRSAVWLLLEDISSGSRSVSFRSAKALELLTWQNFGELFPDLPPGEVRRRAALWGEWWRQNQDNEESEWLRQGVEQALAQLLSDDMYLRDRAIRRLRRVTRMRFFCEYYMSLGDRRLASLVWRGWWQEHQERFRYADFDSIDRPFRTVDSLYRSEW